MVDVVAIAAAAIDVVASETIVITDRQGFFSKGHWVSQAPSDPVSAAASVQPLDGNRLSRIPKNRRNMQNVLVYCRTQLHAGTKAKDGQPAWEPSRFTWNGDTYEVFESSPWMGRYYEALASRLGDQ